MALSRRYRLNDITWQKQGPCIIPGHKKEHSLELECISAMRRWLYPNKDFSEFLRAVDLKRG